MKCFPRLTDKLNQLFRAFLKERRLRKAAIARFEKRVRKKMIELLSETTKNYKKTIDVLHERCDAIANNMGKTTEDAHEYLENLNNKIETLHSKFATLQSKCSHILDFEDDFERLIRKMEKRLKDYEESQKVTARLASIETRITLMELEFKKGSNDRSRESNLPAS